LTAHTKLKVFSYSTNVRGAPSFSAAANLGFQQIPSLNKVLSSSKSKFSKGIMEAIKLLSMLSVHLYCYTSSLCQYLLKSHVVLETPPSSTLIVICNPSQHALTRGTSCPPHHADLPISTYSSFPLQTPPHNNYI